MLAPVSNAQTSAAQAPQRPAHHHHAEKKEAPQPEQPPQDTVELSSAHGPARKAGGHSA